MYTYMCMLKGLLCRTILNLKERKIKKQLSNNINAMRAAGTIATTTLPNHQLPTRKKERKTINYTVSFYISDVNKTGFHIVLSRC